MKHNRIYQIIFGLPVFILFISVPGYSEFYRYVDKDGNVRFADSLSKIPDDAADNIRVYKEKYDHLPESEKSALIEADKRREQERIFSEQKREEEIAKEAYLKSLETKVTIEGNRVLVPVVLENGIHKVSANLILDTGASVIALHRAVAARLHFSQFVNEKARVASGQIINIKVVKLSHVQVGPVRKSDLYAGIIHHEGDSVNHDGLLGMNFLRDLDYSIDFNTQTIRWKTEP